MRSIALLLAVAVLATAGSTPAAAAGWSAPATLGQSNLNFMYGNNVAVAVSSHPQAESVAVWVEPTTMAVKYATQRNGVWSGTKTVYTANANAAEELTDPQVVIDQSGVATAVWGSTKQGPVTYCVSGRRVVRCIPLISFAKVATLAPGATSWGKANLSAQGWTVTDVQVGLDQGGNATAMWSYRATAAAVPALQTASRVAGSAWSIPQNLYASAATALPRLAVGPNGAAVALWTEQMAGAPTPYALRAAYKPAGGTWAGPETVTTQATAIAYLRSTVDGTGRAAAVWNDGYGVRWARRSGVWSPPEPLASAPDRVYAGTGPYAAYGPDIASNVAGDFLITWLESDVLASANSVEAELVLAAGASAHASWPAGAGVEPRVALSPDGLLGMIAWLDEDDSNTYAVALTPDAGWGQPLLMSTGAAQYATVWGTGVSLAAGSNQRASTVWLSVAGMYGQIKILGSRYLP